MAESYYWPEERLPLDDESYYWLEERLPLDGGKLLLVGRKAAIERQILDGQQSPMTAYCSNCACSHM